MAVRRFRRLRTLAEQPELELLRPGRLRLKHALAVIAEERGYSSWQALKSALLGASDERAAAADTAEDSLWYGHEVAVFLNRWFASYVDARRWHEVAGGYLLPYRQHFFVCEAEVIRTLGLDPDDEDWQRIGRDAARPADAPACRRLRDRRAQLLRARAAPGQDMRS
jgi:hypothetical protein